MTERRQLRLEWAERQGQGYLKVGGWTESELRELDGLDAADLGRRLALYTGDAVDDGNRRAIPPVAGRFTLEEGALCFTPRFPFVAGMRYSLLVHCDDGPAEPEVWELRRPAVRSDRATHVLEIYPTAETLPVNLLRLYVHFSAPMSEGWAGRAIRVCRDDTGERLDGVFLPPEPELWDGERRRLTMLLDPGRIKRGLVPNLESGYPLVEGTPVRVIIDPEFRDSRGRPLTGGAERIYRIGPALRHRINPADWRLTPPPAGSRAPLLVDFDRPLDHGLLQHGLRVCDASGRPLAGEGAAGDAEGSWRFTPSVPWDDGDYRLEIAPRLEDVAGNSPVRVFDRDLSNEGDTPPEAPELAVRFTCPLG